MSPSKWFRRAPPQLELLLDLAMPPYIVMLMRCTGCISSRIQCHAHRAYKHDLRRDQPTATTRVLAAGLAVGALAALHSPPTCVLAAAEPNPLPSREALATAAGWAWGQLARCAHAQAGSGHRPMRRPGPLIMSRQPDIKRTSA